MTIPAILAKVCRCKPNRRLPVPWFQAGS